MKDINEIERLPKSFEKNGETFMFSMWVTVFNKLTIGYSHIFGKSDKIISIVIDKLVGDDYFLQTINNKEFLCLITSANTLEDAVNKLEKWILTNEITELKK